MRRKSMSYESKVHELTLTDFKVDFNRRNRQTLWGGCTDANPKLLLNDT